MERRRLLRLLGAAFLAGCGKTPREPVLAPGKSLPVLKLPDLGGRSVEIGGPGQPMLLNFWATWCHPCRAEMGGLDRLYRQLHGLGLAMYGVSVDEDLNLVREFVLRYGIAFPILYDAGGAVTKSVLAVQAFPTTALVRRNGEVADLMVGERAWDVPPEQDAVRALLSA